MELMPWLCLLMMVVAVLWAILVNPTLVKLAYLKKMFDNPNARKLQNHPIPVIGGLGIFIATIGTLIIATFFIPTSNIYVALLCVTAMFLLGLLDDMLGVFFLTKFAFQIITIFALWYFGLRLDNLMGIFDTGQIGPIFSLVLSIIAGVGLINAINFIDGIDGLCSGLGIYFCTICGLTFLLHADYLYAVMTSILIGALIPFFVYNVFSRKYKMFIGDSGSLVMGTWAYVFCCRITHLPMVYHTDPYFISMLLAVFAVPVFDTLRVMLSRMLHGRSPFLPDKNHLHHVILAMGFPHILVTAIILLVSVLLFVVWYLLTLTGMSVTALTIVSVSVSACVVWVIYLYLSLLRRKMRKYYAYQVLRARKVSQNISHWFYRMQCVVDSKNYPDPHRNG